MSSAEKDGVFRRSSKTFYWSTKLFSSRIRADVHTLYVFVRVADNFVDCTPQDASGFRKFHQSFVDAWDGKLANDYVVDDFVALCARVNILREWVDAFFDAMESDLKPQNIVSIKDAEKYMYGSAGVIGLMLCRIFGLDDNSHTFAIAQGYAFQYINFIRDVAEDNGLSRRYIPLSSLRKHTLSSLAFPQTKAHPKAFFALVHEEITRYRSYQKKASEGYHLLPLRTRLAVRSAAKLFEDTARQIERDPFVIYSRKVKPSKGKILFTIFRSVFS